MSDVYLDNQYIGSVTDPVKFVDDIRDKRRRGDIDRFVSVYHDTAVDEIFVYAQPGRACRPLIIVRDGKPLLTERHIQQLEQNELTWDDLVTQGVIEYLDAAEEEMALVAYAEKHITSETTHLEITKGSIVGLTAGLVPFGNFNASSRLIIGSKNQKQALGFYAANFHIRMDMDCNLLHYPQQPLVRTNLNKVSKFDEHPAGQNMVVAIMSYKGYNMDDGVILNKSSIERGLARSTYFRPIDTQLLRYSGGLTDEICIPDKDTKGYRSETDYRFLDSDGVVRVESSLEPGDVVIGKTSPPRFLSGADEYNINVSTRQESSVSLKYGERGIADFVLLTENSEGNKMVQVRLREQRIPELGDKFTSRHGQKGVTGMLIPSVDLPFSTRGVQPDFIFTPHGVSSRMTISHLLECIGGKTGALDGRYIDGTLFNSESEDSIRSSLVNLGFRHDGTETFFDGITGKKMVARIYVGNMYYLRLKHMVANKIQSRARGPIQLLTRQPTEGKAKEGGLRLGEMEKDTFVAHGAALLLKERFDSDKAMIPVCMDSGLVGYYDARKRVLVSPVHGEEADMAYVEVSYAFQLLLNELKSLGIYPKLILEDKY